VLKQAADNKRMLHQPLRGLDGFSARASLQNRRKCGRYGKQMKYIFSILMFIASSLTYGYKLDISNEGIDVSDNRGESVFKVTHEDHKLNNSGSVIITPPVAKRVGHCLLVEYGTARYDSSGSKSEITLPGNIYLYDIRKKELVDTMNGVDLSKFFYLGKSGAFDKRHAVILNIKENFIEGEYKVSGDCRTQSGLGIPSMELNFIHSTVNTLILHGSCSIGPSCIVTYNESGITTYGVESYKPRFVLGGLATDFKINDVVKLKGEPLNIIEQADYVNLIYKYPDLTAKFNGNSLVGIYTESKDACINRSGICPGKTFKYVNAVHGTPKIKVDGQETYFEYHAELASTCWYRMTEKHGLVHSIELVCQP